MLNLENVQTFYGASQALFGMEFSVGKGEVVTLMGRNGMGKTTTVHSVLSIAPCSGGRIFFDGHEIQAQASYKIARMGIGLVPEGRQVFPNLSVRENLIATAENRLGLANPWTLERVFELFGQLAGRLSSPASVLSGGEQQMLAIGRALMTNPKLLILDEATEGLAPLVRAEIWKSLDYLKTQGLAILIIDKNVNHLARIADRHVIIEKGKVVWTGTSSDLAESPDVKTRYLGV